MMYFYLSGLYFLMISKIMLILSFFFLIFKYCLFIEWIFFSFLSVEMKFLMLLDWMSLLFLFTIFFISSMIMFYCCEYMNHDNYMNRFYYLMLLFIISMILVIISPNLLSILLGWDGLGLVSYGLVIYYQNISSFNSGMLTVLMNRIGDVLIIISISLMLMLGSWNYMNYSKNFFILILLIILASFTKSAQFPFSSWLPAAMAAPTPVSSLVHSSTLVTAGIYLLIRFKSIIYLNEMVLKYIMFTGLITMMMAGLFACYEFDFKKIIAYSTLSQLGLMFLIYSMKYSNLSFFHMIIHAMFKSMMFMSSGILIHSMNNYQDIRYMSNSLKLFPFTILMFMIANFSLCGTPFFSGFYSKDKILEIMMMSNLAIEVYIFLMISTALTVMYSVRLMYYLILKQNSFFTLSKLSDWKLMSYSMFFLMIFSLIMGWFLNWLIYSNLEIIYLEIPMKVSVLWMLILSIFLMLLFLKFYLKSMNSLKFIFFFGKMSFFNSIIYFINKLILSFGNFFYLMNDKGWSEYYSKNFIMNYSKLLLFYMHKFSMNYLIYLFLLMSLFLMMLMIL
uniref:NADH-ubiquinone oxidoreductase chain 5 n=1 Tax=Eupelmus sp. ZJUH_2016012 TaxID=2491156 RepID=A0A3S8V0N9_9HYME|nr:NADH dehydrogenase subunit 5 [Eupelmus sp. ZJUH_2016012]